jgi:type II restriction enzyme
MITGNKGEWSEVYTFFKLLAEGRLYAADSDLNKIEEIFYPIINILRIQPEGDIRYIREGNIRILNESNEELLSVPIEDFIENAEILYRKILESRGSFSTPEISEFLNTIKLSKLKASNSDKRDITVVVHDLNTGLNPELGFSIKSRIGNPSTLLNASSATNFTYEIEGFISDDEIDYINNISTRSKIRDRLKYIKEEKGYNLKLVEAGSEIFNLNMKLIDSNLPIIVSKILDYYFSIGINKTVDLVDKLTEENPCNFNLNFGHSFYNYKIKAFLTDIALGLQPSTMWSGLYDATGGYIVVKENGDILCYHIYNWNEFQDYLLKNTKLESASSTRHDYGVVYKNNNKFFIKLNLQIRFTS